MSLLDVLKLKVYYLIDVDNEKTSKKKQKESTKVLPKTQDKNKFMFFLIQSKLHEIGTYEVSKISFILFWW